MELLEDLISVFVQIFIGVFFFSYLGKKLGPKKGQPKKKESTTYRSMIQDFKKFMDEIDSEDGVSNMRTSNRSDKVISDELKRRSEANAYNTHPVSHLEENGYIALDKEYDEHPDIESIKKVSRKCPFCGAKVKDNESVCHRCHHDI